MEREIRVWQLPGAQSILTCQRICEQVRQEVPGQGVEIHLFAYFQRTLIVAVYPVNPELDFSIGSRLEQLVLEAGGMKISGGVIYRLWLMYSGELKRMDPDEDLEIIFELLPEQDMKSH